MENMMMRGSPLADWHHWDCVCLSQFLINPTSLHDGDDNDNPSLHDGDDDDDDDDNGIFMVIMVGCI